MSVKFTKYYMDVAELTAQLSYCVRLKVGAIIVKENKIISLGYNGTLPGDINQCEGDDGFTKSSVVHAEANAILKIAGSHESARDSEIFITHAPCHECAKMIVMSGIKKVYFKEFYRSRDGLEILTKGGVEYEQVEANR